MAELIGLVGKSGTGKSTSMRNLDPKSTFIINIAHKPLPIKGWKKKYTKLAKDPNKKGGTIGNYLSTSDPETIEKYLKHVSDHRPEIKVIVLEDSSYIMSFEIFDRASENSYTKQVEIAKHYVDVIRKSHDLRDDLMLIVITHPDEERDTYGDVVDYKMKTYGKMTDKYMSLDGLFTYILTSKTIEEEGGTEDEPNYKYVFQTNDHSKISTTKTPMGVFDEKYIDNDLKLVVDAINAYNFGDDDDESDETEEQTADNE